MSRDRCIYCDLGFPRDRIDGGKWVHEVVPAGPAVIRGVARITCQSYETLSERDISQRRKGEPP